MNKQQICQKLNCKPEDLMDIDEAMEKELRSSAYGLPESLSDYWLIKCETPIAVGPEHYKLVHKENPEKVWSVSIGE